MSRHRFYATLFLGFGVAMAWCSFDLIARRPIFGALLATFFVGGIARIISLISVGPPNYLFLGLGTIELILPPLVWIWSGQVHKSAS